jgi:adenylosuccinate synthase
MSEVLNYLDEVTPVYKQFKGWNCSIEKTSSFDDLPQEAKAYIDFLSSAVGVPIKIISIGPKRHQILNLQ